MAFGRVILAGFHVIAFSDRCSRPCSLQKLVSRNPLIPHAVRIDLAGMATLSLSVFLVHVYCNVPPHSVFARGPAPEVGADHQEPYIRHSVGNPGATSLAH